MERIENRIARYYDTHPRSVSSPFGGIGSSLQQEDGYFTDILERLGIQLKDQDVLEIGCGGGWFASYSGGLVRTYVGVDISGHCVRLSKEVASHIIQGDAQVIPIKSNLFDYVFCIDSFEHIPDQDIAAKEIHRMLKRKGKVFLSIPNYSNVSGIVKKTEELFGLYPKNSWSPFDNWTQQVLEQFMTPNRVKRIFSHHGFGKFKVVGGHRDFLDGIFPWINHKKMPKPSILRMIFKCFEGPLNRLFPWLSLHNFWLIEKK